MGCVTYYNTASASWDSLEDVLVGLKAEYARLWPCCGRSFLPVSSLLPVFVSYPERAFMRLYITQQAMDIEKPTRELRQVSPQVGRKKNLLLT